MSKTRQQTHAELRKDLQGHKELNRRSGFLSMENLEGQLAAARGELILQLRVEELEKENKKLKIDSDEYVKVKELYFESVIQIDELKKENKEYETESLKSMKEQMSLASNGMKLEKENSELKCHIKNLEKELVVAG
jgi:hypothetical protein